MSSQTPTVQKNEHMFKKLNPGRPRRKNRTWFTEQELRQARQILSYGATPPPPCICGARDWTFNVKDDQLRARCRQCRYEQKYCDQLRRWTLSPRGD